ncbi:MAG: hypothetical protein M3071_24365, partial [Actinomycetota bacterium]|nr:hypothetical protein [Actinomycetota bacterium]
RVGLLSALTDLGLVGDAEDFAVQAGDGDDANDAGRTDRQSGEGASLKGVRCGHCFGLQMRGWERLGEDHPDVNEASRKRCVRRK